MKSIIEHSSIIHYKFITNSKMKNSIQISKVDLCSLPLHGKDFHAKCPCTKIYKMTQNIDDECKLKA